MYSMCPRQLTVLPLLSQVGGRLSVLPLSGLSHGHVDALQPLLSMFLILSFQHVCLAVSEDLKGSWQTAITPLLGYHLWRNNKKDEKETSAVWEEMLLSFLKWI